ncbi:sigma-70 family RNA polymerase sigma factor [Candidatus Solirubrobacter pratensis]|uniref:sigma-70 family RNA polymerase sigma factor n=1 Tax=Candidatus Solirubrobacter pratensis TaxID=1298857 RepID=UPI0004176D49|nr:sigma-70 family RNA polymerase sigma factor [Candidatus Solirubrobacter pratensis]
MSTAHINTRRSVPPSHRAIEEARLFRRYRRDGDVAARNALVARYMPLARHLARAYPAHGERDDLSQVAALALIKAVDRYDPDRGTAFTSFATPTILGELKRYFRDHGWALRVPRELQERTVRVERATAQLTNELGRAPTPAEIATAIDSTVEDVCDALACAGAHHPERIDAPRRRDDDPLPRLPAATDTGYARVDDALWLQCLLERLSDTERTVVRLRFHDDLLQREIAAALGVSQMQVSRILRRALEKLHDQTGTAHPAHLAA